jgi:hypothetical protein
MRRTKILVHLTTLNNLIHESDQTGFFQQQIMVGIGDEMPTRHSFPQIGLWPPQRGKFSNSMTTSTSSSNIRLRISRKILFRGPALEQNKTTTATVRKRPLLKAAIK